MSELTITELSLVALVGASGSGKSTFAARNFLPTEVLSSDALRAAVSDDETDQSATTDAFDILHFIAERRLARGKLVVVDATNVQPFARKRLLELARKYHVMTAAIVFDIPEAVCVQRNAGRPERQIGAHVIHRQTQDLRRSLRFLEGEGFRHVYVLKSQVEADAASVVRTKMWTDRRDEHGPFDIIGDVHGCFDELVTLLRRLGYEVDELAHTARHPDGRKAVFLGDLVDRGPRTPDVLRLVMSMVASGAALCVPGNHENKLVRKLRGRNVQITHGLAETLEQLATEPEGFDKQVLQFLEPLVSHFVLDGGRLVVAHAGLPESMHGRASSAVRDFALYGETSGKTDEYGLPVRYNWAEGYRGSATVVYGHTPVETAEWLNNTICLDTGCVFGGSLTALRYPERELVSVPAARMYYEPIRPLAPVATPSAPVSARDSIGILKLEDVTGRRLIKTVLHGTIAIPEEQGAAALEVMSRFAVDPRWLVYLPPTMSPVETSKEPSLLEHPREAFEYFRGQGVEEVVCQEKHMGSRSVIVLCRDEEAARRHFRVERGGGAIVTRTGRAFFPDASWEAEVLERLRTAMGGTGIWDELQSDWLVLDAEILPWSAKAGALIRDQYAAVGAAASAMLPAARAALEAAKLRGIDTSQLAGTLGERENAAARYVAAYQRFTGRVESLADIQVAPFHVLASEGAAHMNKPHSWHLGLIERLCTADPGLLRSTPVVRVATGDSEAVDAAIRWWTDMTSAGAEGMVVKPSGFTTRGPKGLVQPALKVRGREYLRIIYGPEYTMPGNIERLRARAVAGKRRLAAREYALGFEALTRFVAGEPFHRVHECVFGVLALESEPIDPRL